MGRYYGSIKITSRNNLQVEWDAYKHIKGNDETMPFIDFDKIVPQPISDYDYDEYVIGVSVFVAAYWKTLSKEEIKEEKKLFTKAKSQYDFYKNLYEELGGNERFLNFEKRADAEEMLQEYFPKYHSLEEAGKKIVENMRKHGAPDLRRWKEYNWGIDHNASNQSRNPQTGAIMFFTQHSDCKLIVKKLSKLYPQATVSYTWHDYGDNFSHLGMIEYKNGRTIRRFEPEPTSELALAFSYGVLGFDQRNVVKHYHDRPHYYGELNKKGEQLC